jgi:hypothetical protein
MRRTVQNSSAFVCAGHLSTPRRMVGCEWKANFAQLFNQKKLLDCRIYNSLSLASVLCRMKPLHILFFAINFNIILPSTSVSEVLLFLQVFWQIFVKVFCRSRVCCMSHPSLSTCSSVSQIIICTDMPLLLLASSCFSSESAHCNWRVKSSFRGPVDCHGPHCVFQRLLLCHTNLDPNSSRSFEDQTCSQITTTSLLLFILFKREKLLNMERSIKRSVNMETLWRGGIYSAYSFSTLAIDGMSG